MDRVSGKISNAAVVQWTFENIIIKRLSFSASSSDLVSTRRPSKTHHPKWPATPHSLISEMREQARDLKSNDSVPVAVESL